MLRQISLEEALRLRASGTEVKCLMPGYDNTQWTSYMPTTLDKLLEGAFFLADTDEEIPPEPKKKRKAPKQHKIQLDLGKIKALRDAGWTVAKIADEMGVSDQTILNRLKDMEAEGAPAEEPAEDEGEEE